MAKILVVDDDQYIRELYEEVLKDAGYEVESAMDGEEGFEKMQRGGYDLILLDIMMPRLDGLGVLNKLQELPEKPKNGKIVVLTNLAHDPVIKDATAKGASSYLIKADLTPDQLLEKIKMEIA